MKMNSPIQPESFTKWQIRFVIVCIAMVACGWTLSQAGVESAWIVSVVGLLGLVLAVGIVGFLLDLDVSEGDEGATPRWAFIALGACIFVIVAGVVGMAVA
jgi:hypothetical protein